MKSGSIEELIPLIQQNSQLAHPLPILVLAAQVAPLDTIKHLTKSDKLINTEQELSLAVPDTPLHIAARHGRSDVVMYLMSLDALDDTILNANGQDAIEVARTPELAEAMQVVRARNIESILNKIRNLFNSDDIAGLTEAFKIKRVRSIVNINAQDRDTGETYLFRFARERNLAMVKFILNHGGDPFKRNTKGILPVDATKDDSIRKLLKDASNKQPTVPNHTHSASTDGQGNFEGKPPTMKGFLKKWTKFTSGYKLRWFVLENGVLSYYKRQSDTENACRGSINMKHAKLRTGSSEKLQFEIYAQGSAKFSLKANHPVEASRWITALNESIKWALQNTRASVKSTAPTTGDHLVRHGTRFSTVSSNSLAPGSASVMEDYESVSDSVNASVAKIVSLNNNNDSQGQLEYEGDDDFDETDGQKSPPYTYEMLQCEESVGVGLNAIKSTVSAMQDSFNHKTLDPKSLGEGLFVLNSTLNNVTKHFKDYNFQVREREEFYKTKLEKSEELQNLWSESIREVEEEKMKIEGNLHRAVLQRKRTTKVLKDMAAAVQNQTGEDFPIDSNVEDKSDPSASNNNNNSNVLDINVLTEKIKKEIETVSDDEFSDDGDDEFFDAVPSYNPPDDAVPLTSPANGVASKYNGTKDEALSNAPAIDSIPSYGSTIDTVPLYSSANQSGGDTRALPETDTVAFTENKSIPQPPLGPAPDPPSWQSTTEKADETNKESSEVETLTKIQKEKYQTIRYDESYKGYEDPPRTKLPMDVDDRPKISLWGVLKSLIGKDMTKMTLPVSFNECTNLLMRSAEDMEYTDLLDKAASYPDDPALRMVYVAAFTASSYSSTINRVAKPFNPLLGETFEYVRPDKGFRMISEQVSHHPPVGALLAESARWDFYGASNVKSKFNGRTFEINPLGKWYIVLRPDAIDENGVQEEIYSFRKVTSSVVGIITGNPVVDNHGTMVIENHTTGHSCELVFKQRNWSGSNAYEVKGSVFTPGKEPVWHIGGKWNSVLYSKPADNPNAQQTIIWQAHPRPNLPFNLTPFACTFNALPDRLKPYLAPTDTRFRPDQRAMETGEYDYAADEKYRLEEKQRSVRRQRETRGEVYKPKWFYQRKGPGPSGVGEEGEWVYGGEYWPTRKVGGLKDKSYNIF